jgi:hypothetical protein
VSAAGKSILAFGIYALVLGAAFLLAPNALLRPLGLPETHEPWCAGLGVIVFALGYYYVRAARGEVVEFFRWSVHGRIFTFVALSTLSVLGAAPPQFVAFGLVDLSTATWTAIALKRGSS